MAARIRAGVGLGPFDDDADGPSDTVVLTERRTGTRSTPRGPARTSWQRDFAALMQVGGGEAANDTLRIQTLGGDDEIAVALDVKS